MRMFRTVVLAAILAICFQFAAEAGQHYHSGTIWSRLRGGMSGSEVCQILGGNPAYQFPLGNDKWVQTWHYTDWCQGFGQDLLFSVWYYFDGVKWQAYKKDVDWMTDKYFHGSGVYNHHDMSREWQ